MLLSAQKIAKDFHGVQALRSVDFDLQSGEVHALCGENGAGKSTLMKILSGLYGLGSYQGNIFYQNQPLDFKNTRDSQKAGIAIVYQELSSVENMSVVENLFLGAELQKFGFISTDEMLNRCQELLKPFHLKFSPHTLLSELGIGERQLIEIAKALRSKPKILILDEPTSALSDYETQILFEVLRKLRSQGMGIVIISHKLKEIFAISDRITVLRDGESVGTWKSTDLSEEKLITSMVGRKIQDLFPDRKPASKEVVLKIRNWTVENLTVENATAEDSNLASKKLVENIQFDLHKGEVLGIAGLMGAGRTELLLSLFGALSKTKGEMILENKSVTITSPQHAIEHGIALVSEDRKRYGLILDADLPTNITLSGLKKISKHGWIDDLKELSASQGLVKQLKVKTGSLKNLAQNLSGGNQQKIVVAKCLFTNPKILLMDEPTRGIDVGARLELYQIIQDLTKSGMSVILASSELPELLGTCHRIMVLCEGRLINILDREKASEENIMSSATRFRQRNISNPGTSIEITS